jgi:hypothetical protein
MVYRHLVQSSTEIFVRGTNDCLVVYHYYVLTRLQNWMYLTQHRRERVRRAEVARYPARRLGYCALGEGLSIDVLRQVFSLVPQRLVTISFTCL